MSPVGDVECHTKSSVFEKTETGHLIVDDHSKEITGLKNEATTNKCRSWRSAFLANFALQDGITRGHIWTYYFAVGMTICSFVFINGAQSHLLTEKFGLMKNGTGDESNVSTILLLIDEFVGLGLMGLWGTASDLLGRRGLYSIGFLFMAASLLLFPNAVYIFPESCSAGSFFVSLLFARILFSIGASITSSLMAAILADSAEENCRGRFAGLVGIASCHGAVLGVLLMHSLPKLFLSNNTSNTDPLFSLYVAYYILAGLLLLVFLLVCIFMSPPKSGTLHVHSHCPFRTEAVDPEEEKKRKFVNMKLFWNSFIGRFKESLVISWNHPLILASYFSGFLARSLTTINVVFMPLWIYSMLFKLGKCDINGVSTLAFSAADAKTCTLSRATNGMLSGIFQVSSLLFSPFIGYLSNKYSSAKTVMMSCLFLIVGYALVLMFPNPLNSIHYLSMIILGIGQIGVIVAGLAMVTSHAPKEHRGSISGLYSLSGSFGIICNSYLSNIAYMYWMETGPFFVLSLWAALLFTVTLFLLWFTRSRCPQLALH